jgi:hypothetical protein
LKEQEFLRDEYKNALVEFRRSEHRLMQLEADVVEADAVLRERETYTRALAGYLDRDTAASSKEVELRETLARLEAEIRVAEAQLEEVKSLQNPAVAGSYNKERGFYMIEIQRGERTLQNYEDQQNDAKRQIAACTVNGKYRHAIELEYNLNRQNRKRTRLRQAVQKAKIEFEKLSLPPPHNDPGSRRERGSYQKSIQFTIEYDRMREIQESRPAKRHVHLEWLLRQVAELNDRLRDLGLESDVQDVDQLRERVFGPEAEDDEPQVIKKEPEARALRQRPEKKAKKSRKHPYYTYYDPEEEAKRKRKRKRQEEPEAGAEVEAALEEEEEIVEEAEGEEEEGGEEEKEEEGREDEGGYGLPEEDEAAPASKKKKKRIQYKYTFKYITRSRKVALEDGEE